MDINNWRIKVLQILSKFFLNLLDLAEDWARVFGIVGIVFFFFSVNTHFDYSRW